MKPANACCYHRKRKIAFIEVLGLSSRTFTKLVPSISKMDLQPLEHESLNGHRCCYQLYASTSATFFNIKMTNATKCRPAT